MPLTTGYLGELVMQLRGFVKIAQPHSHASCTPEIVIDCGGWPDELRFEFARHPADEAPGVECKRARIFKNRNIHSRWRWWNDHWRVCCEDVLQWRLIDFCFMFPSLARVTGVRCPTFNPRTPDFILHSLNLHIRRATHTSTSATTSPLPPTKSHLHARPRPIILNLLVLGAPSSHPALLAPPEHSSPLAAEPCTRQSHRQSLLLFNTSL